MEKRKMHQKLRSLIKEAIIHFINETGYLKRTQGSVAPKTAEITDMYAFMKEMGDSITLFTQDFVVQLLKTQGIDFTWDLDDKKPNLLK